MSARTARTPGVYLEAPTPSDWCNFVHREAEGWNQPATAVLEFQLNNGQYTIVLAVCDFHLAQIHEVTAP